MSAALYLMRCINQISQLNILWLIGLLAIFLTLPSAVQGQESPITAYVDKTNFFADELITLTVTVVDDSAQQPRPILPRLDGLAVIDLDISTDIDINHDKVFTKVTYVYLLQPRRTGLLTIPPAWVKIDNEIFKTSPISVNIEQGSAAAPSLETAAPPVDASPPQNTEGESFFVESIINEATPYLNQQVIHTLKLYQRLDLSQEPMYESPAFEGFETMGLPLKEYALDIDDGSYRVTEIRTALFPQQAGQNSIPPIHLTLPETDAQSLVSVYADPLTIDVQALPDGPPEFSGAVGQYEINAWIEPPIVTVHEPASLFVAVNGTGNIHALPEPIWPAIENWRVYNALASLNADIQEDGLMTGTQIFERLIVPDQIGEFMLPPASLVYFDPVDGEYRTISTEPQPIKVISQPDPVALTPTTLTALATATPVSIAADTTNDEPTDSVNQSFLGLLEENSSVTAPILGFLALAFCIMIPLATIAGTGAFWWWRRQEWDEEIIEVTEEAPKQEGQQTHPVLDTAMQQHQDNYKAIHQALHTYLESMLNMPVSGLTRPEIARYLRRAGVDETYVQRINDCLAQCETGRYGPMTDDAGWSLMVEVDQLLFDLDKLRGENA